MGASATFNHLLSHVPLEKFPLVEKARKALSQKHVQPTFSFGSLLMQIDGSAQELSLPSGNVWIDVDKNLSDLTPIFVSFLSAKDPETWSSKEARKGKSSAQIAFKLSFDKFKHWEGVAEFSSDPDYVKVKEEVVEAVMSRLYDLMPQLKGKVDWVEFMSPLDLKNSIHSTDGAIYGLKCDPARFKANLSWLSTNVGVKKFVLGGEDVFIPGIGGALVGATLAASCVDVKTLRKLWKLLSLPERREGVM